MPFLRQAGMRTVEDTQIIDLLEHWIVEQQQRDDLCLRERPRIGILAAQNYVRDGDWPSYGRDAPTIHDQRRWKNWHRVWRLLLRP